jgi:hypothetical protein
MVQPLVQTFNVALGDDYSIIVPRVNVKHVEVHGSSFHCMTQLLLKAMQKLPSGRKQATLLADYRNLWYANGAGRTHT